MPLVPRVGDVRAGLGAGRITGLGVTPPRGAAARFVCAALPGFKRFLNNVPGSDGPSGPGGASGPVPRTEPPVIDA